jgi:uncharacterized protein YceH (UPF0502 family)
MWTDLAERGAQLRSLDSKAAALRECAAGKDGKVGESDAADETLLEMTLDMQQDLMVYLGTVMLLVRRATFLEEMVSQAERLIQGGVLQELEHHLASLNRRRRIQCVFPSWLLRPPPAIHV